jgi:CRISPR-associated endonuclease/helicase Cas3
MYPIPTGLGKTAVIGIWLAARAVGTVLPRRLVYVVDRRAVVDQATAEAEDVVRNLTSALKELPDEVSAGWRRNLGLSSDDSLPVSTLRGQFADNRRWLQNPAQAAIVVGTVDMIGSRLLFDGYGVSPRMRSIHAALLGSDTLVVIDEAHLVPPFEIMVRQVGRFERPFPVPSLRVLALSATGTARAGENVFRLSEEQKAEAMVQKRLDAPKRLMLHETEKAASALAERAFELGKGGSRVVVFCNSRDKLARVVQEDLRKLSARVWKGQQTTALLVGARRVAERECLTGRRKPGATDWEIAPDPVFYRFLSGIDKSSSGAPAFLIATSAGEVGIDLDADHMVCDLVEWERMVQRLGRVNRSGRDTAAMVDVFATPPAEDAEEEAVEDYKKRLAILRAPFESALWPVEEDGRRPAGPEALAHLKEKAEFRVLSDAATTAEPLRPELRPVHVEAWSMTSLSRHTGRPDVAPWIRGWVTQEPQCRLVWRAVLPVRGGVPDKRLLKEFLEAFPPHLLETLETETYRAAEVLKARAKALPDDVRSSLRSLAVVVLDSGGEVEEFLPLGELEEEQDWGGRTLVIDRRLGGLSADGLLDPAAADPPSTLDQQSNGNEAVWSEAVIQSVGRRLRIAAIGEPPMEGWVREAAWPTVPDDDDEPSTEWRIEKWLRVLTDRDAARSAGDQALQEHMKWVVSEAEQIARALDLSDSQRDMLVACAETHDLGKGRRLWQTAMGAPEEGGPYAKTSGRKANGKALNGYRHEFGSLRDAESRLAPIADDGLRDLARHIVVAHHGWSRPVIAPLDPDEPPSLAAERAREAALRFVKLQAAWGPWGLAWWESLLRSADWAASARFPPPKAKEDTIP